MDIDYYTYFCHCPICGRLMEYIASHGQIRDLTNYDERISEGFEMLSDDECFVIRNPGLIILDINIRSLDKYLSNLEGENE